MLCHSRWNSCLLLLSLAGVRSVLILIVTPHMNSSNQVTYDIRNLEGRIKFPCNVQVLGLLHTAAVRNVATSVEGLSDVIEKKAA